jgi:hypothetical protein
MKNNDERDENFLFVQAKIFTTREFVQAKLEYDGKSISGIDFSLMKRFEYSHY